MMVTGSLSMVFVLMVKMSPAACARNLRWLNSVNVSAIVIFVFFILVYIFAALYLAKSSLR
jgi:hypothetical protein